MVALTAKVFAAPTRLRATTTGKLVSHQSDRAPRTVQSALAVGLAVAAVVAQAALAAAVSAAIESLAHRALAVAVAAVVAQARLLVAMRRPVATHRARPAVQSAVAQALRLAVVLVA